MREGMEGLPGGVEVPLGGGGEGEPVAVLEGGIGKRGGEPLPGVLPVLPLVDAVGFPDLSIPLLVGKPQSIRLVDDVAAGDRLLVLVAQRVPRREEEFRPGPDDVYRVGTVGRVVQLLRLPQGGMQVVVQGIARARLLEFVSTDPYLRARVEVVEDVVERTPELEALVRAVTSTFRKVAELAPYIPPPVAVAVMNIPDPGDLADFLAANMNLETAERQEILETFDVRRRLERIHFFLQRELELLELGSKVQRELQEEVARQQREAFLRRQLEAIRRELGETDERMAEVEELRRELEGAGLPEEARKEAERELNRLERLPPGSPEYGMIRTYLDWMVSLPWQTVTEDNLDVGNAARILDEDHYNLEKVKERILEFLAVRKLKADQRGPILCFLGPPGVGKTSLGQSIARALGRKFVRMSLGGIRDEAEIRGHRRTYIGALPGRIIQGMRRVGSRNPVFMLDELDKVGLDFRGDPSAALLEVLDPEQNHSFVDNYLGVPFDLSRVLFIATVNMLDTVPPALRDRLEVIEIPGYTEEEKVQIARGFIFPKQRREHGLGPEHLELPEETLRQVIRSYTREAGVRQLEREIASICRKVARRVAAGEGGVGQVLPEELERYLGPPRFPREVALEADEVGVATGLAWTPTGGEALVVEASLVPGRGNLILTGHLGEVMRESAQAAMTYARALAARAGLGDGFPEKVDVHIHVPAGAIPKDGPSAGVTMATALVSAVAGVPVKRSVAMTGEITLRGKVLPVGGIKEKVLAAHRIGARTVILPEENRKDLSDVPAGVRQALEFVFARTIDDVLNVALADPGKVQGKFDSNAVKSS